MDESRYFINTRIRKFTHTYTKTSSLRVCTTDSWQVGTESNAPKIGTSRQ